MKPAEDIYAKIHGEGEAGTAMESTLLLYLTAFEDITLVPVYIEANSVRAVARYEGIKSGND